jgi:hypothetical protein
MVGICYSGSCHDGAALSLGGEPAGGLAGPIAGCPVGAFSLHPIIRDLRHCSNNDDFKTDKGIWPPS